MNVYKHSRGSLFLLELILNVLIFTALLIVGLKFFIQAHTLTNSTSELHNSVTACTTAATLYENSDGSLQVFEEKYPNNDSRENQITIFLDCNFNNCEKKFSKYTMHIRLLDSEKKSRISRVEIEVESQNNSIYKLVTTNYTPLTPLKKEVP